MGLIMGDKRPLTQEHGSMAPVLFLREVVTGER